MSTCLNETGLVVGSKLPGDFDGEIAQLLSFGDYVFAIGRFSKITYEDDYEDTPACNLALFDLANQNFRWRGLESPLPLSEISAGLVCESGLLLGGIGGVHLIGPKSFGVAHFEAVDPEANGSDPLPRLIPIAEVSNIESSKPASKESRELIVWRESSSIELHESDCRSTEYYEPEAFQTPGFEARHIVSFKDNVVVCFAPSSANWRRQAESAADSALAGLFGQNPVQKNETLVVTWSISEQKWELLGRLRGTAIGMVTTEGDEPRLVVLTDIGLFVLEREGAWVEWPVAWLDKPSPWGLSVDGENVVVGYGSGHTSHQACEPAFIKLNPSTGESESIGLYFTCGGGGSSFYSGGDNFLFSGSKLISRKVWNSYETAPLLRQAQSGKLEEVRLPVEAEVINEIVPSRGGEKPRLLINCVCELRQITFGVAAERSCVILL
jgi:hypothetical protein